MAAHVSRGARASSLKDRYQWVRELGVGDIPVWAALELTPGGENQLVVVECMARGGPERGDQAVADWMRGARRLVSLEHPNVARTRDILIRATDVLVVSEFLDGVRLSELAGAAERPPLEFSLRILVDVLAGLSAVHNLRDANRQPLKLVHGALSPRQVVVGLDGVARLVGAHRLRTAEAAEAAIAYLAPEVLLADATADARADVYSVGAMLWEALTGRPIFVDAARSAIVTRILSGRVPRATVPPASPWAAPLADAAARALAADPEKRFASAAAFAAEIRRVAGPKLAQPVRVAGHVRAAYGDRIRSRREALNRGEIRPERPAVTGEVSGIERRSDHLSIELPIEVAAEDDAAAPAPGMLSPDTPIQAIPVFAVLAPPVLPPVPPLPKDLGAVGTEPQAGAPAGDAVESPGRQRDSSETPVPSAPPTETTDVDLSPIQPPEVSLLPQVRVARAGESRRWMGVAALIAAPLLLLAGALAWWLGSAPPPRPLAATPSVGQRLAASPTPTKPAVVTHPAAAAPAASAPAALPLRESPKDPEARVGPASPPSPRPPVEATPPAPTPSPRSLWAPPVIPAQPVRPAGRHKYDPQGI